MAANLPEQFADVATTGDVPDYPGSRIRVRREVATISRAGTILLRKDRVLAVEQNDQGGVLIRFEDGTAWAAKFSPRKKGGCGCG